MSSNPNLEDDEIQQYKSPLRTMTKLTLAVMWIALFIAVWWNQSTVPADPWWVFGMPACGLITFAVLYGPAEVKLASPHGISRLLSDSIKTNNPIATVPAIRGRPELGIYAFGSVDAPHFGIGTFVGTRELVVVPTKLARKVGRNLYVNCQSQDYTDHTQLPPDVFEKLKSLDEYRPDMHVEYGLYPEDQFDLTERDRQDFKDQMVEKMQSLSVPIDDKTLDALWTELEDIASSVSPFAYGVTTEEVYKNYDAREKALNHEIEKLRDSVRHWESMYMSLLKTVAPKTQVPPPNIIERLGMVGPQEDKQDGGHSG